MANECTTFCFYFDNVKLKKKESIFYDLRHPFKTIFVLRFAIVFLKSKPVVAPLKWLAVGVADKHICETGK